MGIAELLALIAAGRQVIGAAVTHGNLLRAQSMISEQELQTIKDAAEASDSAWDDAVAAARARIIESN